MFVEKRKAGKNTNYGDKGKVQKLRCYFGANFQKIRTATNGPNIICEIKNKQFTNTGSLYLT